MHRNATISILAIALFSIIGTLQGCGNQEEKKDIQFEIQELNDTEYPDNPDIGFRHSNYQFDAFEDGLIAKNGNNWDITFELKDKKSIQLKSIDLRYFVPQIPEHLKKDTYLSRLALINQEWNRNQVKFLKGEFSSDLNDIVRVDLARNCLNSYLWEVIIYKEEKGKETAWAHGWFNFPSELYQSLFDKLNVVPFATLRDHLVNWKDPESGYINKKVLREFVSEYDVDYHDKSDTLYPLGGARVKKRKEIIYPESFKSMHDLQNDSTVFATFSPPGFYNKKDPRTTELGRFRHLESIHAYTTTCQGKSPELTEFQLNFASDQEQLTTLTFGGLDLTILPQLSEAEANSGWKTSMGFGNHSFYESYKAFLQHNAAKSPYYGYLSDENGRWLDSHKIGIDGPIMHWDSEDDNLLHIWLLSFERHALIGHYSVKFNDQ